MQDRVVIQYLQVLRRMEDNPPFSVIGALVRSHKTTARPRLSAILRSLVEGTLVAVLFLSLIALNVAPADHQLVRVDRINIASPHTSDEAQSLAHRRPAFNLKHSDWSLRVHKSNLVHIGQAPGNRPSTDIGEPEIAGISLKSDSSFSSVHSSPVEPAHLDNILVNVAEPKWSALLALSAFPLRGMSLGRSITVTTSIRYAISGQSSLVIEVGNLPWVNLVRSSELGLRDTSISIDGSTYKNTIGSNNATERYATHTAAVVLAGYRRELPISFGLQPAFEVLAGPSTTGFAVEGRVGIQMQLSMSIFGDLSLQARDVLAHASAPQLSGGLEARLGVKW